MPRYPAEWQAYFLKHQPATLIDCGKNDHIFPAEVAYPFKKSLEFHLLDTGHLALEEDGQMIADTRRPFLNEQVIRIGQK